jgi:hypothetical protein
VSYARKALVLGRLNVLYGFHLLKARDKDGAVRVLAAGLRFSEDVGNGGSLFATLVAKDLLMNHLRAVAAMLDQEQLSVAQRLLLKAAVNGLGDGLDWQMAATRDLEALRRDPVVNSKGSAALTRIISAYVAALNDDSKLSTLDEVLRGAPNQLASAIPNAKRVLEEKRDLNNTLLQTRSFFR